jgi:predicted nucleotide-binding protein (sugar kinase/HSP70/actin superfamily)
MKKITKLLLSILTIISISCKKEEKDPLIIPTVYEYDSMDYAVNVVANRTELLERQLAALSHIYEKRRQCSQ